MRSRNTLPPMELTPEQSEAVKTWIAAGDNLSLVQKKLSEQFKLSLTYRDVRFLVDDLNLQLKDAAPKVDTSDVSKGSAPKTPEPTEDAGVEDDLGEEVPPGGAGSVQVAMDKVTLIPGAVASGSVTFSDGVTGK